MVEKKILSGNEAIARGAYEGGVKVAAAYPGTPSTEILEEISTYEEIYAEWSTNEKVALEVAIGGSMGGARSLAAMKHVGLNVASDPFMTFSYTGVNGGCVIITADDPELHSSQNEQDNRYYAKFASVPMLEPSDSQEAKDFVVLGLDLSERYDTPVLLRLTTRISHSKSVVRLGDYREKSIGGFIRNPEKYVMLPAYARARHKLVIARLEGLREYAESTPLNSVEEASAEVGIISSGIAYQYAKEIMPQASYLKLGITYPLPYRKIAEFAAKVKRLLIIEELEPFLEEQIKASGIKVSGKEFFPQAGELSVDTIEEGLSKAACLPKKPNQVGRNVPLPVPPRPPIMCSGCPHRGLFMAIKKLDLIVASDIGCYTLGALPPLNAMDSCICMGASIGNALGLDKVRQDGKQVVAVIGDSTFLHSGMTGLLDIVYNKGRVTTIILDNRTTAMTGGQDHPGTGKTIQGDPTSRVDLVALCKALGVEDVQVVDPYDYEGTLGVLKESVLSEKPSVIITNRPCVLIERQSIDRPFSVNLESCTGCQLCLKISCPGISLVSHGPKGIMKAVIDSANCPGCGLCSKICPVNAINNQ